MMSMFLLLTQCLMSSWRILPSVTPVGAVWLVVTITTRPASLHLPYAVSSSSSSLAPPRVTSTSKQTPS